jgi:hypothetical protein
MAMARPNLYPAEMAGFKRAKTSSKEARRR